MKEMIAALPEPTSKRIYTLVKTDLTITALPATAHLNDRCKSGPSGKVSFQISSERHRPA